MRAFIRKSLLTAGMGLSLWLVAFASAQDVAPVAKPAKAEQNLLCRRETSSPDALDWRQFPQLKGKVAAASGTFSSFLPPKAGQSVTLDARNPIEVKLGFSKGTLPGRAPLKVHEVFWEPNTGDFRGMRLLSEGIKQGVKTRYIMDIHCYYKPNGQPHQGRFMDAVLVEEVEGQFRSVAAINLEFEGELPRRRFP